MQPDPNIQHLQRVVECLGDLADELMLVGGCAAGLLVTNPGASPIRQTKDVDLVVEAVTYVQYHKFCEQLEARGLRRTTDSGDPICKWYGEGIELDIMPLDESVLVSLTDVTNIW